MKVGSDEHKKEFIDNLKKTYQENIWMNELHLMRLDSELAIVREELDKLNAELAAKGRPPAAAEKKRQFVLERGVEHKNREIQEVRQTKLQNEFGLAELLPKWEAA